MQHDFSSRGPPLIVHAQLYWDLPLPFCQLINFSFPFLFQTGSVPSTGKCTCNFIKQGYIVKLHSQCPKLFEQMEMHISLVHTEYQRKIEQVPAPINNLWEKLPIEYSMDSCPSGYIRSQAAS